jgi:hypothetical protein
MLSQRAAFAHGVIDGRTAQEFEPGAKAAEEVDCGHARMQASPRGRVTS